MILKYNNFLNKINEQNDWGQVKNLLGKLLGDINDDLKNKVSNLTDKLITSKNSEGIKNIIINFFREHEQNSYKLINNVESIDELNTLTIDNLKSIYGALISIFNLIDNVSFDDIFKDSPSSIKKLFNEDEKTFDKNINIFTVDLISGLSSKFGFNQNDVFNQLSNENAPTDKEQKEQIGEATGEEIEMDDKTNIDGLKKETISWFNNIIYRKLNNYDFIK